MTCTIQIFSHIRKKKNSESYSRSGQTEILKIKEEGTISCEYLDLHLPSLY